MAKNALEREAAKQQAEVKLSIYGGATSSTFDFLTKVCRAKGLRALLKPRQKKQQQQQQGGKRQWQISRAMTGKQL